MGTYLDLQTRVNRRVIDLPSAVQAEVPTLINEALARLQEGHNFKYMEAEIPLFTQVGAHTLLSSVGGSPYILPVESNTFKEWRGEPWFIRYQDGSPRYMSWAPSREAIWGMFTQGGAVTTDASYPRLLLDEISVGSNNRTISVYPLPDGFSDYPDGEYRITAPAYINIGPLVNGGDNNWFTNQTSGTQYIIHWATAQAFALNWDYQKMAVHEKMAEMHRNSLVKADKLYRLGSVREFVPHWQGVHSSKTRI